MPNKLSPEDLTSLSDKLPDWQLSDDRLAIQRSFRFADFAEAFTFMTRAALMAERMNHHPDWRNLYNRVDVSLTTHDLEGVSDLDLRMAKALNSVYQHFCH
jgi:4a-hydroxytetrahydrobiopterin dehydratase